MKNAPFLLSSIIGLVAVVLSIISFGSAQTNNELQDELRKKQTQLQETSQEVTLKNQDFNRYAEIINTGATVAQKLGPPILRDMGYFAAKGNDKMKDILKRYKFDDFIMKPEQVKEIDKQISELKAKQGAATTPTPPTPDVAPSPSTTPAAPTTPTTPTTPAAAPRLRPN